MDQKSSLHVETVCKRIPVHFDRIAFISLSKQRQKSMAKKEKTLTVTRCFESNESKQIEPRGASLIFQSAGRRQIRPKRQNPQHLDTDFKYFHRTIFSMPRCTKAVQNTIESQLTTNG